MIAQLPTDLRELSGIADGEPFYSSLISIRNTVASGQVSICDLGKSYDDIKRIRLIGSHQGGPWFGVLFPASSLPKLATIDAGELRHSHIKDEVLKLTGGTWKGRDPNSKLLFRPVVEESLTVTLFNAGVQSGFIEGDGVGGLQGDLQAGYTWDNETGVLEFIPTVTTDNAVANYLKTETFSEAYMTDEVAKNRKRNDQIVIPGSWRYFAFVVRDATLSQLRATAIIERYGPEGPDGNLFLTADGLLP